MVGRAGGERNGLRWPWGIAVDGRDNVFVANFAGRRIAVLCGATPENCLPGQTTGDMLSPDDGYLSDALVRVTGIQVDPSGNVWAANNWINEAFDKQNNPGGKDVVVFIGLAAPVKTPLIGLPQQP